MAIIPKCNHDDIKIEIEGITYIYCRKCTNFGYLEQVLYRKGIDKNLKGVKSFKKIKDKQKKKDFENFLRNIGKIK